MTPVWPPTAQRELWWQHLSTARWFGGKGRDAELITVTALPWLTTPTADRPGVRTEIAEVGYRNGDRELYQLLMAYGEQVTHPWGRVEVESYGSLPVTDAVSCELSRQLLWQALAARHPKVPAEATRMSARVFGGEQSNTSLLIGDRVLLKFFRKLLPGRNLDIEMHQRLAEAGSTDCADLYGWVEQVLPGDQGADDGRDVVDLAMIIEQFAEATDG